jgi:hypothetical protein
MHPYRKNFPYDLVLITWEDIVSCSEWSYISEIKKSKTAVCSSVGWLIERNNTTTVVMADLSFEENKEIKQGGSYTTIPTKNIISIKKIKL